MTDDKRTTHVSVQRNIAVRHRAHTRVAYVRYLVGHPCHVAFVFVMMALVVFMAWSLVVVVPLALATELAILCLGPRTPAFRRWVDRQVRERDVREAAATRAAFLARLTNAHRVELQKLEVIADVLSERVSPDAATIPTHDGDDCLGIARMLAAYVGGALAYASASSRLMTTDRDALDIEIASLEQAVCSGRTESLRAIAVERLHIAKRRAARWDRSRDDLEVMQAQLALVSDIIRLAHENATAPRQSVALSDLLAHAMTAIPEAERTIHELVELLELDGAPDPRVLELGRRAVASSCEGSSQPIAAHIPE